MKGFWAHSTNLRSQGVLTALALFLFFTFPTPAARPVPGLGPARSCHVALLNIRYAMLAGKGPVFIYADGTEMPIARAFEKEGLFYSDIAEWFDRLDKEGATKQLVKRLDDELQGKLPRHLLRWLERYAVKYRITGVGMTPKPWEGLDPKARLAFLLNRDNPFEVINIRGREALFYDGILSYDHLRPGLHAPPSLTVGDDLGSYEIRSDRGEADRRKYHEDRELVEEFLEGSIGHQHIVHAWPEDAQARARMAPYYIELLDAGTWFLFWRQMMRSPNEAESILSHPFLGVYTRASLDRLHQAVVAGDVKKFSNKFRMIGARNVTARDDLPGQAGKGKLPDFELRSGNKGIKRDFMEDLIEARLMSGDYRGLRDYSESIFDPSAPIAVLAEHWLNGADIRALEAFEERFSLMRYSRHPLSHNHTRNKIVAALLPWGNRLSLEHKADVLFRAQGRYAESLARIAIDYLKRVDKVRGPPELADLREETTEALERLAYLFAHRVRLDVDFERYLVPRHVSQIPPLRVELTGDIDVNAIDLGIEYSFRFPESPRSYKAAEAKLKEVAETFSRHMGGGTLGTIEQMDTGGHGHGLSIRFKVKDPHGRVWRVEWDGIRRSYENGEPVRPRSGHVEIPSPKMAMRDAGQIANLYRALFSLGYEPRRGAGGAHANMDLGPLFDLPEKVGARKLANLIAYFESRREMFQFLWQHPFRVRSAIPVKLTPSLIQRLNAFRGGWNDLGKLLYEEKYFNPYITRKPAYTQLNATAVMGPAIPPELDKSIDIKNPEVQWFPAFGGKGKDRIEFRLFDAPPDVYMAALQINYVRAMMDKALNAEGVVSLKPLYPEGSIQKWKDNPRSFLRVVRSHFKELGLRFETFLPLVLDAVRNQDAEPMPKPPLEEYEEF